MSTLNGDRAGLEDLLGKDVGGFAVTTLRRGVNFRGSAALPLCDTIEHLKTFAAEDHRADQDAPSEMPSLKAIIAGWTTPRLISGHVGERDGLALLSIDVEAAMRWQPFVDNSLAITVETLTLSTSRLNDREAAPALGFAISGQITLPSHQHANYSASTATAPTTNAPTYAYRLGIDASGQALRLQADLVTRPDGDWLSGLRIPGLSDVIPAGVIPTVKTLGLQLPFKKDGLKTLRLSLAWDKWVLVGEDHADTPALITMQPTVHIVTGFAANNTEIRLDAKLRFRDNGTFDLTARYPSGDFAATLSSDTPLNFQRAFGGLLARLTPDPEKFSITVLDLEGNLPRRDFTFHAVARGELNFAIAETALTLSHIDFSVSHAASEWEGSLSARLTIAKIPFELSAALTDGSCHFACVVSSVAVKDLSRELLGIAAPEALRDVVLKNFCLDFSLGKENTLNLSAESEGEIAIGGLRIGIDRLALGYDKKVGGLFFDGDAHLRYASQQGCDVPNETFASLGVSYKDRRGLIQGSATGLDLNLADMIGALSQDLGLPVKLEGTAAISEVHVLYGFGEGPQRFAMHLKLYWGKGDADSVANWYFIAQKPSDGPWRSIMYMTLPPLDFYALPYVGEALRGVTNAIDRAEASTRPSPSQTSGIVKPVIGIDNIALGIASKMDSTAVASMVNGIDFAAGFGDIDMRSGYSLSADIALPNARRSIVFPRRITKPPEEAETSATAGKSATRDSVPTSTSPTHGADNAANRQTTHSATATADTAVGTTADTTADTTAGTTADTAHGVSKGAPSRVTDSGAVVGRAFGPVTIARINASASKAGLRVDIDATAKLGPIEMSLIGLRADSPLSWPPVPTFALDGMRIACTTDTLTLAGAIQKADTAYVGQIVATLGKFSLSALALYEPLPQPSIGMLMVFRGPLGGPPAFYITGLAGGVGYHRDLVTPTIDTVAKHPFIEAIAGSAGADALTQLRTIAPPKIGNHWIALGLKFTSFNLVDSIALLTLSFGSESKANLLGRSTFVFPPPSKSGKKAEKTLSLAKIELALLAELRPALGEFCLLGQLTPSSYLFDPEVHLSGGFAFCFWFGPNPHAGDFVLTVGGYHPSFTVPDHYPRVPPLALNWQITSQLSIKGNQYFALTPSTLMMGGRLSVAWQSGRIRAWIDFEAHFLIQFQPFWFEAVVRISVGVDALFDTWFGTFRVSVAVGANLYVSGPPFNGVVQVSAAGIAFDIAFGERTAPSPLPIDWDTFRRTLLPAANPAERARMDQPLPTKRVADAPVGPTITDSLITVSALSGLVDTDDITKDWIVSANDFAVEIACVVPVSRAVGPEDSVHLSKQAFGVRPLNWASGSVVSVLNVSVQGGGRWCVRPIVSQVASGIWGDKQNGRAPMLSNVLTGVVITPRHDLGKTTTDTLALTCEDQKPVHETHAWWVETQVSTARSADNVIAEIQSTIAASDVIAARQKVLDAIEHLSGLKGESTMMLTDIGRSAVPHEALNRPASFTCFTQGLPEFLTAPPLLYGWDAPCTQDDGLPSRSGSAL
ncbi:DUF6603 domain-containing protein [Robbsia sp. KACC 23696]|uniref:DUF6603 domain-containing protein n=1 Tax=Robbsia sp. KACC 23696 TaxID=3149231 RepID=UPI00325BF8C8